LGISLYSTFLLGCIFVRQLANNIFSIDKSRITLVLDEIELFYYYLLNNDEIYDDWYFKNIFTTEYWYYLKNYNWLSPAKQDYLHQGILNFILFLSYNSLEHKSNTIDSHLFKIEKAVRNFVSDNKKSLLLKSYTLKSIDLLKQKSLDANDNKRKAEIYKALKWTLINVILKQENEIVNQR